MEEIERGAAPKPRAGSSARCSPSCTACSPPAFIGRLQVVPYRPCRRKPWSGSRCFACAGWPSSTRRRTMPRSRSTGRCSNGCVRACSRRGRGHGCSMRSSRAPSVRSLPPTSWAGSRTESLRERWRRAALPMDGSKSSPGWGVERGAVGERVVARRNVLRRAGRVLASGPDGKLAGPGRAVRTAFEIAGVDAVRLVLTGDRSRADRILEGLGTEPPPDAIVRVAARPGLVSSTRPARARGAFAASPARSRGAGRWTASDGSRTSKEETTAEPRARRALRDCSESVPRCTWWSRATATARSSWPSRTCRCGCARPCPRLRGAAGARVAVPGRPPPLRTSAPRYGREQGACAGGRDRECAVEVAPVVLPRVGRERAGRGRRELVGPYRSRRTLSPLEMGRCGRARGRRRARHARRPFASEARGGGGTGVVRSRSRAPGGRRGPGNARRCVEGTSLPAGGAGPRAGGRSERLQPPFRPPSRFRAARLARASGGGGSGRSPGARGDPGTDCARSRTTDRPRPLARTGGSGARRSRRARLGRDRRPSRRRIRRDCGALEEGARSSAPRASVRGIRPESRGGSRFVATMEAWPGTDTRTVRRSGPRGGRRARRGGVGG